MFVEVLISPAVPEPRERRGVHEITGECGQWSRVTIWSREQSSLPSLRDNIHQVSSSRAVKSVRKINGKKVGLCVCFCVRV